MSTESDNVEKLTKADVERLVSTENNKLSFRLVDEDQTQRNRKGKTRAACWANFKRLYFDEKPLSFVTCNHCANVFKYNTANGTNAFTRHDCRKVKPTDHQNEKPCQKKEVTISHHFKKTVPESAIHRLNDDIVAGLAKDLRPLSSVERDGFLLMAQSFINFGAKYGQQSAKNVLQHRTILTRNRLPALCASVQEKIKTDLRSAPSYPKFSYTTDMWMEKNDSSHFLSLSAHYISSDWELKKALLGMIQFDDKKTTANIRKECEDILGKYFEPSEVDTVICNSASVTDGGSSMLSIFPRRKPCYCHKINLFVEWTLNNKNLTSSEQKKIALDNASVRKKKLFKLSESCPKMQKSLVSLRELVTHFKRTSLNSQLSSTLKQEVITRWNSELISITSYLIVQDEVKELCLRKDSLKHISSINDSSLKELQAFLQPIAEASEILSGDTYPTIHLVALFLLQLEDHIKVKSSDSHEMRALKAQAALCFEEYCEPDEFCYMAAMFDPRYKSLKFAPPETRGKAIDMLERLVALELDESMKVAEGTCTLSSKQPQSKKVSRFSKFKDSKNQSEIVSEVEKYRMYPFPDVDDDDFNIQHFWRDAKDFPALQKVARWLLAVPASETTEERVFSDAGYVKAPRRTVISGKNLSNLVFLCRNFDKYK